MEGYLQQISEYLNTLSKFDTVKVVVGNEACDLDSAVSALVYAYFLHTELNEVTSQTTAVIPLLNIKQEELSLRTEVTYYLHRHAIPLDKLIFWDSLDVKSLHKAGKLELVLVDHHVMSAEMECLRSSVVSVIDHHPQDPAWCWSNNFTLNLVGSCCTLVADKILHQSPHLLTSQCCMLLYGPIVLDTACFSPAANRTTELDLKIAAELESRVTSVDRSKLFAELLAARADVSGLTASQLLIKDMKVTCGIPVAGLPILVEEFISRPQVAEALTDFCKKQLTKVAVVMGLHMAGDLIQRDIAVFHIDSPHLSDKIVEYLKTSTNPALQLEVVVQDIPGLSLFRQLNIKASRKQVLPLIRSVAESWTNC